MITHLNFEMQHIFSASAQQIPTQQWKFSYFSVNYKRASVFKVNGVTEWIVLLVTQRGAAPAAQPLNASCRKRRAAGSGSPEQTRQKGQKTFSQSRSQTEGGLRRLEWPTSERQENINQFMKKKLCFKCKNDKMQTRACEFTMTFVRMRKAHISLIILWGQSFFPSCTLTAVSPSNPELPVLSLDVSRLDCGTK